MCWLPIAVCAECLCEPLTGVISFAGGSGTARRHCKCTQPTFEDVPLVAQVAQYCLPLRDVRVELVSRVVDERMLVEGRVCPMCSRDVRLVYAPALRVSVCVWLEGRRMPRARLRVRVGRLARPQRGRLGHAPLLHGGGRCGGRGEAG